MSKEAIYDVIVIGAGPAGISAAIWSKRLGLNVLVVEQAKRIGGQLHHIHNQIIDYPGVIANNGTELNQLFEDHLDHLGIPVNTNCTVKQIITSSQAHIIVATEQSQLRTRFVLLASGSRERRLHLPGEQEMLARGEIYSSKKDLVQLKDKQVLIVGGGDRALEGACTIASVASTVLLVHRNSHFRARQEFLNKIPQLANVIVKTNSIITEIHGNHQVEAATVVNLVDGTSIIEAVDAVLIRVGREPVDQYLSIDIERTQDGLIVVDADGRTSTNSIFAIGDLVNRPQISSISNSIGQGMRAASAILDDIKKEKERHFDYGDLS